jgi:hypothetical protein
MWSTIAQLHRMVMLLLSGKKNFFCSSPFWGPPQMGEPSSSLSLALVPFFLVRFPSSHPPIQCNNNIIVTHPDMFCMRTLLLAYHAHVHGVV